nr:sigma-70 family RNA polymerase sigma factor [uncultured Dyadobacter sp.]
MERDTYTAEFEALFRQTWNKVYQLCLRHCGDKDVAKDLTQNIYTSLWQRRIRFDDLAGAEKYLAKAARYQCVQHWRNTAPLAAISSAEPEVESPEELLLYQEFAHHARAAIDGIPEPSRSIFLLSREQEYTYHQIARERNISPKTVEFHISRVLRILREKLLD